MVQRMKSSSHNALSTCNNASFKLALLRRVLAPLWSPFTGHDLTRRPIGEHTCAITRRRYATCYPQGAVQAPCSLRINGRGLSLLMPFGDRWGVFMKNNNYVLTFS